MELATLIKQQMGIVDSLQRPMLEASPTKDEMMALAHAIDKLATLLVYEVR